MKRVFITGIAALFLATGAAHAKTYTYMCQVGPKSYPVTVTSPNEAHGVLGGGTIMWRGMTYPNVKANFADCKVQFTATRNGVTIELCTATQGSASLTLEGGTFDCQMPEKQMDEMAECTRGANERHLRGRARQKFLDRCANTL
jgi:hypothetical protein